jgi:hypothetical protein
MLSCLIKNPNWELDDIQFWEKSIQEKKNTVCDDQKKSIFEDDKKKVVRYQYPSTLKYPLLSHGWGIVWCETAFSIRRIV